MTTLKDLRTESLTKLKSELTLSDRLSTTAALSARTVSRRLQELMEAFRKYDKSHIKYLVRLTKEDAPINLEPHYEIVDRYDLAMDKMEALEESLDSGGRSQTHKHRHQSGQCQSQQTGSHSFKCFKGNVLFQNKDEG